MHHVYPHPHKTIPTDTAPATCCDIVHSQVQHVLAKGTKLDVSIAANVRVGGNTLPRHASSNIRHKCEVQFSTVMGELEGWQLGRRRSPPPQPLPAAGCPRSRSALHLLRTKTNLGVAIKEGGEHGGPVLLDILDLKQRDAELVAHPLCHLGVLRCGAHSRHVLI